MYDYWIIDLEASINSVRQAADVHHATVEGVRKDDAGELAVIETLQGAKPDRPGLVIVSGPLSVEEAQDAVARWGAGALD